MGAGHASTSIGVAVGIKEAMKALKASPTPAASWPSSATAR